MAEGTSDGSPHDGEEPEVIIYEYPCMECGDNGYNTEAAYYCENCGRQLCRMCLREHDRKFRFHLVLGSDQRDRWPEAAAGDGEGTCPLHPDKPRDMICVDHNETCCSLCTDTLHRSCKNVHSLNEKGGQSKHSKKDNRLPGKHRRLSHFSRRSSRNAITGDHVYTVMDRQWYCVRLDSDEKDCEITGLCQLVDGYIIVIDRKNCNIKMLDDEANYAIISHCALPEFPMDVCVIADTEVAVTVTEVTELRTSIKNEIHFIGLIEGQLEVTKVITLRHGCQKIAHHQSHLYVADPYTVYKYTMGGQLIKKIFQNKSGDCTIESMSLSNDGSRIYLANRETQQLITMDIEGRHVDSDGSRNMDTRAREDADWELSHTMLFDVHSYPIV
ncbi:hypothetical protein MAR_001712, partial [Mya arenaria]